MNTTPIRAHVHRYDYRVAVALHDGPTIYLTPADAKQLADALNACALNCAELPFAASSFGTRSFDFIVKI